MQTVLTAIKIDLAIKLLSGLINSQIKLDQPHLDLIYKINEIMLPIKPKFDYDDVVRKIWIKAERGNLTDYGDYQEFLEEDLVSSYEDFEDLFKYDYPEEVKWYSIIFTEYNKNVYLTIDNKVNIDVNEISIVEKTGSTSVDEKMIMELLKWILYQVGNEMHRLRNNPEEYNNYLDKNLSLRKRTGKIKRMTLWESFSDIPRFDTKLGKRKINLLRKIAPRIKSEPENCLESITSGDFYHYCEICYDGNNYFKNHKGQLSAKQKYYLMADRRDDGLSEIKEGNAKEFNNWYKTRLGGHPWEICRGGNSTHISLFAQYKDGKWFLRLNGSSTVRVVETINAALALYQHNIPFMLDEAEEILAMVTGEDFIGIVPEHVTPRYCHSFFPKEDRIIDFMNPWNDSELTGFVIKVAEWYPLEKWEVD